MAARPRSVQAWLESRREGLFSSDHFQSNSWSTSGLMPRPPATAYGPNPAMAAGAKIAKGFPASMVPNAIVTAGSPRATFDAQFAVSKARAAALAAPPTAPATARKDASSNSITKQIISAGQGRAAAVGDVIDIAYVGWLSSADPSNHFDAAPHLSFTLGKAEVIPGWEAAVAGMREGEIARLHIPSAMAYGARGRPPQIPPHADLSFELQLHSATPPHAPPPTAADAASRSVSNRTAAVPASPPATTLSSPTIGSPTIGSPTASARAHTHAHHHPPHPHQPHHPPHHPHHQPHHQR